MDDVAIDERRWAPAGRARPQRGQVRWFSPEKGYGLIRPDGAGPDVFVRHGDIAMNGFRALRTDQAVEYVLDEDEHGPVAREVRPR